MYELLVNDPYFIIFYEFKIFDFHFSQIKIEILLQVLLMIQKQIVKILLFKFYRIFKLFSRTN